MNKLQAAAQLRRAIQIFAASLDEGRALEVASIYPGWEAGRSYKAGEYFTYGVNRVGDPQLYKVAQDHSSQAEWLPDELPALYTPVGLTNDGWPIWSQPAGAHDAYSTGDVVAHKGKLYCSLVNENVWEPGVYGWEEYQELESEREAP